MNLDHVFKKTAKEMYHTGINPSVPDDLLCKCKKCGGIVLIDDVRSGGYICPKCGGYFRMSAYERIKRVVDEGTFLEWDRNLVGTDPLQFEGYEAKLAATRLRKKQLSQDAAGSAADRPFFVLWMADFLWRAWERLSVKKLRGQ